MTHYESDLKRVEVRRLLEQGNTRTKIVELLGIPLRTVDMYISDIHKQDKERWLKVANESIENRAILIKDKYEKIAFKAEAVIDNPDCNAKDLDIAAKLLIACHRNIYEMIKNGPLKFTTIKAKELEDKEDA